MLFVILFSVAIILIALLFFMKNSKKKKHKNFVLSNFLDLDNINLPSKVKENINPEELIKSTTELYKIFKSLDYLKKDINEIESKIEWNSWEVSQFLYLLQLNRNILMQDCDDILHKSILKLTEEQVINEMKYIILKYNRSVVKSEVFFLKNQVIWSAKEISIIFYYLSLTKEIDKSN